MSKFLCATVMVFGLSSSGVFAAETKDAKVDAAATKAVDTKKDAGKKDEKAAGKTDEKAADKKTGKVSCSFVLTGNDQMKFGLLVDGVSQPLTDLKIPKACLKEKITIALHHVGTLPKEVMGHNVVVTTTAKQQETLQKFAVAGPSKGYVDDSVKEGVIGHTDTIGGGQKTSKDIVIAPNTLKEKESYSFFCSFPGHAGLMTGKLQFVDEAKS